MKVWRIRQSRADIHVTSAAFVDVHTFSSDDDGARILRCVLSLSQSDEADPSMITVLDLYRGAAVLQTWDVGNLLSSTLTTAAALYDSPQREIPMDVIVRAGDILRVYSKRIATSVAYVSLSIDLAAPPRVVTEDSLVPFPGCALRGIPGRSDIIGWMGMLGALSALLEFERGINVRGWMTWPVLRRRVRRELVDKGFVIR